MGGRKLQCCVVVGLVDNAVWVVVDNAVWVVLIDNAVWVVDNGDAN